MDRYLIALMVFVSGLGCATKDSHAKYAQARDDTIRLGTATAGRNYHQLGQGIKRLLEDQIPNLYVDVSTTEGSVDNIHRLADGVLDLAIVQNDIAFSADRGLDPFGQEVPGLRGIMMLYLEPIYIVTNRNVTRLSRLTNDRISVGPRNSGTAANAETVLRGTGLWNEESLEHFRPGRVLELLLENRIQAAFINAVGDSMRARIAEGTLSVVSLPTELLESLTMTYPYLSIYESEIAGELVRTISVKSMLVGRRQLEASLINRVTSVLSQDIDTLRNSFPARATQYQENDMVSNMPLGSWHSGSLQVYRNKGLIESQLVFKIFWLLLLIPTLLLGGFGILNVSLFAFNRRGLRYLRPRSNFLKAVKAINLWIIRLKYVLLVVVVAAICLTSVVIIQEVEQDWAIEHNTVSRFEGRNLSTNALWMFVFAGSGYHDELFPRSPLGKFFAALIPVFGIGGIVTFIGFLTSDHIKKRIMEARGVKKKSFEDHVIICGWNNNVPFLVNNLLHENVINRKPIVILADMEEELPLEKFDLDRKMVGFVRGDATKRENLAKANMKAAHAALVVSDDSSSDPDARNILKVLIIETYCRELEAAGERRGRDNIYTIAEIQDADNFDAARDAMVDEIVSLGHIKSKIFVQSVQNPGVSRFVNEILTYNEYNDIYSHHVSEGSALVGHTFDELLNTLRDHQILLLSVNVGNTSDRADVRQAMEENGLERHVLTNPIHDEENAYRTEPGDLLIMLAQYEETVRHAIDAIENAKSRT